MSAPDGFDFLTSSPGGIRHFMRVNDDDTTTWLTIQDTTDILDRNKAMATHNDGYSPSRELRRVATIPAVVRLKWLQEEGWDCLNPACRDKLRQKLNSSEYLFLRTAPGRL